MLEIVTDRERLVAALRERGVDWLAPSDAKGEPVSDETLIASLAAQADPRLRQALTGWLLLRPALADAVPKVLVWLTAAAREAMAAELVARYMAAVYLQNLWRTRLKLYLGGFSDLPDFYSSQLGLPPGGEGFGKPGLDALADWRNRQSPIAYNHRAEYHVVMEHVFASLKQRAHSHEWAIAS